MMSVVEVDPRWIVGYGAIAVTGKPMRCTTLVLLLLALAELFGCNQPVAPKQPLSSSKPESTTNDSALSTSPSASEGTPIDLPSPTGVRVSIDELEDLASESGADRWLRVVKLADEASGGWATGVFSPTNKITIETRSVSEFSMDLSKIAIDWTRRVVLRIDGHTSELTRAHYPVIRLGRSPTGGWNAVDDSDAKQ